MTEAGRTRWTDERIDDLALRVRDDIGELRSEMREFRAEMREEFRAVRADNGLNRRWLGGLWLTTTLGFLSLIVETSLK